MYLESVRLMRQGVPLFKGVFASQPPLWYLLIDGAFTLFGECVRSGRLVTVSAYLLAIVACIAGGWQLRSRLAGLLSGALVAFSPFYLLTCRSVEAESPSTPLAALGVALAAVYFRRGRRLWWILAVSVVTAGALVKLFAVYAYLPLAFLAVGRWWVAPLPSGTRLRGLGADAGIAVCIVAVPTALFALVFGPEQVWQQVVAFHLAARHAYHPVGVLANAKDLGNFLKHEPLLVPMAPLSLVCIIGGWRGLAALLWLLAAVAGAVSQHPLFDHHAATVIPALALAIGVGWGQLWVGAIRWVLRARERPGPGRALFGVAGALSLFAAAVIVYFAVSRRGPVQAALRHVEAESGNGSQDTQMAQIVDARTTPNDVLLTDQQTIAFWAHRSVPPGLTDTSFVRIASGYLTADQVIADSQRAHVTVVVLDSGRLNQLPAAIAWIDHSFPHHQDFGHGRVVYWR